MEEIEPIFLNPNEILRDNPDNPLDFLILFLPLLL